MQRTSACPHTHLLVTLALLSAVGCSAPSPAGDGEAESDSAFRRAPPITLPPPVPLFAWQFRDCLTPDQRVGLPMALYDYWASRSGGLVALHGSEPESACIDGEERGGFFTPGLSQEQHLLGLARLSIRNNSRLWAFRLSNDAFESLSSYEWDLHAIPHTFDDNGTLVEGGRYELIGWDDEMGVPHGRRVVHVRDQRNPQLAVDLVATSTLDLIPDWQPHYRLSDYHVSPVSSSDPLIQTIINASQYLVQKNKVALYTLLARNAGGSVTSFYLRECPSLSGWQLGFDMLTIDDGGGIVASGGDLIL
jgi:hypothetical protein